MGVDVILLSFKQREKNWEFLKHRISELLKKMTSVHQRSKIMKMGAYVKRILTAAGIFNWKSYLALVSLLQALDMFIY